MHFPTRCVHVWFLSERDSVKTTQFSNSNTIGRVLMCLITFHQNNSFIILPVTDTILAVSSAGVAPCMWYQKERHNVVSAPNGKISLTMVPFCPPA